jgi:Ankyrin repeat
MVEEIINLGAMINITDMVGWTPMHIACYFKRKEIILLLLKHGANLFSEDREGVKPLSFISKNEEIVKDINVVLYLKETIETINQKFKPIPNVCKSMAFKKSFKEKDKAEIKNRSFCEGFKDIEINNDLEQKNRKLFDTYKFIPRKHTFYLNSLKIKNEFETENTKTEQTEINNEYLSSEQDKINEINTPNIFPKTINIEKISQKQLTNIQNNLSEGSQKTIEHFGSIEGEIFNFISEANENPAENENKDDEVEEGQYVDEVLIAKHIGMFDDDLSDDSLFLDNLNSIQESNKPKELTRNKSSILLSNSNKDFIERTKQKSKKDQ